MDLSLLPKFHSNKYTERVTIPISSEVKKELDKLKFENRVNYVAWIRQMIEEGLKDIKPTNVSSTPEL